MLTRTEAYEGYGPQSLVGAINRMEEAGWSVRQVLIVEKDHAGISLPQSNYIVVYERDPFNA